MAYYRFPNIAAICFLCLFFLCLPFSNGQDINAADTVPAIASEYDPAEPAVIKLSVEEVTLDVVVLDKKGNQIKDLTSEDFEVFQDDKRQEVLSGVYIDSRPDTAAQYENVQKNIPDIALRGAAALKKEDVCRTVLF